MIHSTEHTRSTYPLDKRGGQSAVCLIALGAVLFYLPFISRQFLGDDWLWLYNAKAAWDDPFLYLGRPMYGYFRPLNMLVVSIWLKLAGANSYFFSLINMLLHGANVVLLARLLDRFGVSRSFRNLSAFVFAFYMLNSPAIEWIAVGHDLWVTLLCLVMSIRMFDFSDRHSVSCFLQILGLCLAATLFKESGFVSIGIFVAMLVLRGKNPLGREFRIFTAVFVLLYSAYTVYYFQTRTFADKELVLGLDTIVHLWYFMSYQVLPIAERVVSLTPGQLVWMLKILKVIVTLALPVIIAYAIKRAGKTVAFFVLWSMMFVSTIAIFKWDIDLFTLYPESTASRFMYSPVVGFSIVAAWLIIHVSTKFRVVGRSRVLITAGLVVYVAVNLVATWQMSKLLFDRQRIVTNVIRSFEESIEELTERQSVVIYLEEMDMTPQFVRSGKHMRALLDVQFSLRRTIAHRSLLEADSVITDMPDAARFYWNTHTERLERFDMPRQAPDFD